MITLLLHLLRLLPFLVGGHRQLAIENLALRHQLAIYKRTVTRPTPRDGPLLLDRAGQSLDRVEAVPRDQALRPADLGQHLAFAINTAATGFFYSGTP